MLTLSVEGAASRSFTAPEIIVGRSTGCDLQLDDDMVSRRHLVIRREGRNYVAEDVGSMNGTFLGAARQRITRAILRAGDELLVGQTLLRVQIVAEPREAAAILEPAEAPVEPTTRVRIVEALEEAQHRSGGYLPEPVLRALTVQLGVPLYRHRNDPPFTSLKSTFTIFKPCLCKRCAKDLIS